MIALIFHVILFSFSAVMVLRSLIHQRWNDIAVYFVLLAFSVISIGAIMTANIVAQVNNFEIIFGGP